MVEVQERSGALPAIAAESHKLGASQVLQVDQLQEQPQQVGPVSTGLDAMVCVVPGC